MTFTDKNSVNVLEELPLNEFLNYESDEYTEYVHIFPDLENREMNVYRSVKESPNEGRIKTTIENVKLLTYNLESETKPDHIYVTWTNADTILTWLDALKNERSETQIIIEYWETNNSEMIEESNMNNESIIFKYETNSGRSNKVEVSGLYKNELQKIAKW